MLVCLMLLPAAARGEQPALEKAKGAFEKGEYAQAIEILKSAAGSEPNNGDVYVLLARSYLELNQYDAAVDSAEKAVAIDPKNSDYHRWLGEAYGAKAAHAPMFSAYSLARKTQKEFDAAVQLDAHNYDAQQDLIEYDCTAPGMVGGGDEKAQPLIEKLMAMDAAEGHYATGICRAQKKDYAAADAEFAKALENKPKSAKAHLRYRRLFSATQECGETRGGRRRGGRARAAGSPRKILPRRGADPSESAACGCGETFAGLPAVRAHELRVSASLGRALLAPGVCRRAGRIRRKRAANIRPR